MSIAVALAELAATLARYDFAYLLTIGDDARPHVVAVRPELRAESFRIAAPGRRTSANLAARPEVTLVWPPATAGEHSLIVDGTGALEGAVLVVGPSRAVLHRGAPAPAPDSACDADCVELPLP